MNAFLKTPKLLLPSLIFALVFVAYANVFDNQFLWDDEFLIDENNFITSFDNIGSAFTSSSTAGFGTSDSFYRPMQTLVYMIAYSLSGPRIVEKEGQQIHSKHPWAFHLANILIHGINGVLLFLLILQLWNRYDLAFGTSALWSVHPVHTEAVTYMSGTADPLSATFALGALICFHKLRRCSKYRIKWTLTVLSLGLFLGALLSKEAIIILPGLLMLLVFVDVKSRYQWKAYLVTLPHWIIAFSYLVARKTFLNFEDSFEFYKVSNIYTENIHYRVFTFLATLPEYLKILILPIQLHMERHFPVFVNFFLQPVLLGTSIALFSGWCLWSFRKSDRSPIVFGILWFFIAFVPMTGILIPVNSFLLEHWLYITSMGMITTFTFLLFGDAAKRIHRHLPSVALVALIGSGVALTLHRNQDWKDPITFYSNVLSYNVEGTPRIHNNIAMAYADEKKWKAAIFHYTKSIEMSDTYPQPHYNLARIFIKNGDYEQARKHLNRSLEIQPRFSFSKRLLEQINSLSVSDPKSSPQKE